MLSFAAVQDAEFLELHEVAARDDRHGSKDLFFRRVRLSLHRAACWMDYRCACCSACCLLLRARMQGRGICFQKETIVQFLKVKKFNL